MQNTNHWREQLIEIHEQLLSSSYTSSEPNTAQFSAILAGTPINTREIVNSPIRYIPHEPLLVFNPDVTVMSALHEMSEYGVDFSLIQESQDTLLGVLDRVELETLIQNASGKSSELSVSAVMGRNICIEPDTATLLEVMDRITMGACPCTIIVDSSGCPRTIVTPQSLVRALTSGVGEVSGQAGEGDRYGSLNTSNGVRIINPLMNKVA